MKYTFLMPAYKATYLKEAIDSILSQTYRDFRLIISDDCSPENLKAVVEQYDDERITFRRNEKNIGGRSLVEHWNLLQSVADSEYVILAPDDDLYAPAFLEQIDQLTSRYPEVNVLKSRSQKIDETGEVIAMDRIYEERITQMENLFHQALPDHMSGIGNYVFKTSALKAIGGFVDYPLAWWSDVMTNVLLSDKGMAITRDILFTMRMSGISITTRKSTLSEAKRKAAATMKCYDDIERLIASHQPLSKWQQEMMSRVRLYFTQWLTDDLLSSARAYNIKEAKDIVGKYPSVFANKMNKVVFWKSVLIKH